MRNPQTTGLTEKQITEWVYARLKEGEALRRDPNGINKYPGNSIGHMLSAYGWVREDLRMALIKADPQYAASQGEPHV